MSAGPPQETSENVETAAHSAGQPDPQHHEPQGTDVGGPASTSESATEDALTGTGTVGTEDDPGSQAADPN